MSNKGAPRSSKQAKEDATILSNQIALKLAKHEAFLKLFPALSADIPRKFQRDPDAEDEVLFRNQPEHLGVGAPIPSHFLVNEAKQNSKTLRATFFPAKDLRASKARSAEDKLARTRRAVKEDSSDKEEGRSGLGRAKKLKLSKKSSTPKPAVVEESEERATLGKVKRTSHKEKPIDDDESCETTKAIPERTTAEATGINRMDKIVLGGTADSKTEAREDIHMENSGMVALDPAELKRLKKRQKKQRKKLRDLQKKTET